MTHCQGSFSDSRTRVHSSLLPSYFLIWRLIRHSSIFIHFFFSVNGASPSTDYEKRRGSSGTAIGGGNSSTPHMRAAASVDRLNIMGEGNSGRKLPSMPDSLQRSPMKISGREGEIAALKRSNRRSASSHNLVNNSEGEIEAIVVYRHCVGTQGCRM